MRKVFIILVALMFMATSAQAVSLKQFTANIGTGTSADYEQGYVECYNNTGYEIVTGMVMAYDLGKNDGRSVTCVKRLGQPVAGVTVENIATGTWGKLQVYGYCPYVRIVSEGGYVTAGYPLYAYSTGPVTEFSSDARQIIQNGSAISYIGQACTSYNPGVSSDTFATQLMFLKDFGVALDSNIAGGVTHIEAFLNCL